MDDEPLDLSMNSASWTKETSKDKQHVAEKDKNLLPVKSKGDLVAEFSSFEENIRKADEQESKKSFYSPKISTINKTLESPDVIAVSNSKTKRKMNEEPSKNSEAKRLRDTYSATSRKTEDKKKLPGASDYSEIASADHILSQPSSSDGNSNNDLSVIQELPTSRNYVSSFICKQCSKSFSSNSYLKKHSRTHTGEKPFGCKICDQRFAQNYHLQNHTIRLHTNHERSYRCKKCEKSFAFEKDLAQHTKRHTTEKPFPCKECGKSFLWESKLTRHSKTHTGEKPFACKECGKSFSIKDNLTRHSRIHTAVRSHVCQTCGKAFTAKRYLKAHENTHKDKSNETQIEVNQLS